jgi:hypothetical protein
MRKHVRESSADKQDQKLVGDTYRKVSVFIGLTCHRLVSYVQPIASVRDPAR